MIVFVAAQPAFTPPRFEGNFEAGGPVEAVLASGTTRKQAWAYRWLWAWRRGDPLPGGALRLRGHGWGHNLGLCLATARFRVAHGATAEQILAEAFPAFWRLP